MSKSNSNKPNPKGGGRGKSSGIGVRSNNPQRPKPQNPDSGTVHPIVPQSPDPSPQPSFSNNTFKSPALRVSTPIFPYDSASAVDYDEVHEWDKLPTFNPNPRTKYQHGIDAEKCLDPVVLKAINAASKMGVLFKECFQNGKKWQEPLVAALLNDTRIRFSFGQYLANQGLQVTSCLHDKFLDPYDSCELVDLSLQLPAPKYSELFDFTDKVPVMEMAADLCPGLYREIKKFERIRPVYFPTHGLYPSVPMNSVSFKRLKVMFPKKRFETKKGEPHPHPLSHITRYIAAYEAMDFIVQDLAPFNKKVSVVDIGGKVSMWKHHPMAPCVWATSPSLTARDVFRNENRDSTRSCSCKFPDHCVQCATHDAAISVHSLYYLSMEDVGRICHRYGVFYAVVHDFPKLKDSIHEVQYTRTARKVVMSDHSSLIAYSHPPLDWLFTTNVSNDTQYKFVWNVQACIQGHYIIKFLEVQSDTKPDDHLEHPAAAAIRDMQSHGVKADVTTVGPDYLSIYLNKEEKIIPAKLYYAAKNWLYGKKISMNAFLQCKPYLNAIASNAGMSDADVAPVLPALFLTVSVHLIEEERYLWKAWDSISLYHEDYNATKTDFYARPSMFRRARGWVQRQHFDWLKIGLFFTTMVSLYFAFKTSRYLAAHALNAMKRQRFLLQQSVTHLVSKTKIDLPKPKVGIDFITDKMKYASLATLKFMRPLTTTVFGSITEFFQTGILGRANGTATPHDIYFYNIMKQVPATIFEFTGYTRLITMTCIEELACWQIPECHLPIALIEASQHESIYPFFVHALLYALLRSNYRHAKYISAAVHLGHNIFTKYVKPASVSELPLISKKSFRSIALTTPLTDDVEVPEALEGFSPLVQTTSVCTRGMELPPQAKGSKVTLPKWSRCVPTVGTTLLYFRVHDYFPIAFRSCTHNEFNAICGRVTLETRPVSPEIDLNAILHADNFPNIHSVEVDPEKWWNHLSPKQRDTYLTGFTMENPKHILQSDLFIKKECIVRGPPSSPSCIKGTPRAIQTRHPALVVALGPSAWQYTKDLEQYVNEFEPDYVMVYSHNSDQLAEVYLEKLLYVKPNLIVDADGVKQDAHQRAATTYAVRQKLGFKHRHPALRSVHRNVKAFGKSMTGVRFSCNDSLPSGDVTTVLIHLEYYHKVHKHWRDHVLPTLGVSGRHCLFNKSDDLEMLLNYGTRSYDVWCSFESFVNACGSTLTKHINTDYRFAEFLASRCYPCHDRIAVVPKPGRLLTKIGWTAAISKIDNIHIRAKDLSVCFSHLHALDFFGPYFTTLGRLADENLQRLGLSHEPTVEEAQRNAYYDFEYKNLGSTVQDPQAYRDFICSFYGLSEEQVEQINAQLSSPDSYPYTISCPLFSIVVTKDLELEENTSNGLGKDYQRICLYPACIFEMEPINTMDMPRRAKNMIDTLIKDKQVEPAAYEFLLNALDPFHDTVTSPQGYPDQTSTQTLPLKVTMTSTITAPADTGEDNWEAVFSFLPVCIGDFNRPIHRGTIQNGYLTNIDTGVHVGTGLNVFTGVPGFNWTTSDTYSRDLCIPNVHTRGQWRLVGVGFEVSNTTAQMFKQGAVTIARVPTNTTQSSLSPFQGAEYIPTRTFDFMTLPPGTQSDLSKFPGSLTWAAEKGVYAVPVINNTSNPIRCSAFGGVAMTPCPQTSNDTLVGYVSNFQSHTTVPIDHSLPFDSTIAHFSGLSPETSLVATVHYYIERVPSNDEQSLVPLTRPACPFDPLILEIYTRASQMLPVAVPVGENPLGEWFNKVMSVVTSVAPSISKLVAGPIPGLVAKTVSQILNGEEQAKANAAVPRRETIASAPTQRQPIASRNTTQPSGKKTRRRKRRGKAANNKALL